MRFDITVEPSAPMPEFMVNRARKRVLKDATEGLRDFIMSRSAPV